MPTPRRPILSQLLVTTATALAVVALYLYLTRPSVPVIHYPPLYDQLARPITVSFDDRPLTEAIAAIATDVGLPIDVDWPALATMGITPEQPVTLHLKDVPAHATLSSLLAEIPDGQHIPWTERTGRLAVGDATTVKVPVVRAYDIENVSDEYVAFRTSMPNQILKYFDGIRFRDRGWAPDPSNEEVTNELIQIIRNLVDPDSWVDHGGSIGRIEYKMNRLLIAQTPENHEKIQRILLALRLRDTTDINTPDRSDP